MLQKGTLERPKSHNLQNTVTQQLHDFSSMCSYYKHFWKQSYAKPSKVLLSCWNSVPALKWQPLKLPFIHWKRQNLMMQRSGEHGGGGEAPRYQTWWDTHAQTALTSCGNIISRRAASFFHHLFSITSCTGPAALLLWHKNSWYLMFF